jgi:type I restriction enzyme S subunit
LGEVGDIFNGNSINAKEKEVKYLNVEGYPFIATKDVGYGWEELDYNNGICIPFDEQNFKVAKKGTVLICAEGGSAGKKCGITNRDICFGNKLFAVELFGNIIGDYILAYYQTPTFFNDFSEKMTGIIGGISLAKFKQIKVPIPPLAEQHRIVAKVEELMALCDELEKQETHHLKSHALLVETLLGTLTQAKDAKEFQQAWSLLAQHFDDLFTTEDSIDQLKQTILQLAVMGKLVPQDPKDEPASVLLERIRVEKERFMEEKKLGKQGVINRIQSSEKLHQLPDGWMFARFGEVVFNRDAERIPLSVDERSSRKGEFDYYGLRSIRSNR